MFSFQLGTLDSSIPDWFDWLNLGASFLGALLGVFGAYLIFRLEQKNKDKEEKILSKNEIELFKKNIRDLIYYIDKSIKNIETSRNEILYSVNISLELNANFLKLINLNRIFHYDIKKVDILNELVFYLSKIDVLNDSYKNDTKSFVYDYNVIHLNYINYHREFDKIFFKLENSLNKPSRNFDLADSFSNNKANYFYLLREMRVDLIKDKNNPKIIDRETRTNCLEKILDYSKKQNFDEAKEIQILCESIIKNINEMKGVEESHKSALDNNITVLKRTRELIQLYIS